MRWYTTRSTVERPSKWCLLIIHSFQLQTFPLQQIPPIIATWSKAYTAWNGDLLDRIRDAPPWSISPANSRQTHGVSSISMSLHLKYTIDRFSSHRSDSCNIIHWMCCAFSSQSCCYWGFCSSDTLSRQTPHRISNWKFSEALDFYTKWYTRFEWCVHPDIARVNKIHRFINFFYLLCCNSSSFSWKINQIFACPKFLFD